MSLYIINNLLHSWIQSLVSALLKHHISNNSDACSLIRLWYIFYCSMNTCNVFCFSRNPYFIFLYDQFTIKKLGYSTDIMYVYNRIEYFVTELLDHWFLLSTSSSQFPSICIVSVLCTVHYAYSTVHYTTYSILSYCIHEMCEVKYYPKNHPTGVCIVKYIH